ncbi:hypothetical protein CEE87_12030, partial [Lactobacillus crispatus]
PERRATHAPCRERDEELTLKQLRHPEVAIRRMALEGRRPLTLGPSPFEGRAAHRKSDLSDLRLIERTQPA